jgi:hypothetical protein
MTETLECKFERGVIMFEKFMMVTNALIASGVWVTLIYIVSSK